MRTGFGRGDEEVFSGLLTEYYSQLFTSSNPQHLDRVLEGVQLVVTEDMNA